MGTQHEYARIWRSAAPSTDSTVFMLTFNVMELTTANMTCCLPLAVNTTLNRMCPENHSIPARPTEAVRRKKTKQKLTHYGSSESLGSSVCPHAAWMNAPGKTLSPNFICWIAAEP